MWDARNLPHGAGHFSGATRLFQCEWESLIWLFCLPRYLGSLFFFSLRIYSIVHSMLITGDLWPERVFVIADRGTCEVETGIRSTVCSGECRWKPFKGKGCMPVDNILSDPLRILTLNLSVTFDLPLEWRITDRSTPRGEHGNILSAPIRVVLRLA